MFIKLLMFIKLTTYPFRVCSMSYSHSSSAKSPHSSAAASWLLVVRNDFVHVVALRCGIEHFISSKPSALYQRNNTVLRNIAVKNSANLLNTSRIDVVCRGKPTAVFIRVGGARKHPP